jgi:hypothetical protein
MLPAFLASTYEKYKQDTSTFLEWLSGNAKKCGFEITVPETVKPAETPAAAPRLKGKQRKLAKQGNLNTAPAPAKQKQKSYLVSTKMILAQANAIADSVRVFGS